MISQRRWDTPEEAKFEAPILNIPVYIVGNEDIGYFWATGEELVKEALFPKWSKGNIEIK